LFVYLFHLYPLITKKRLLAQYFGRTRTRLKESTSEFSGCFFGILPLNLMLVRRHQADALSKDVITCPMRVKVEPRSRDRDYTVAVKTAL